MGRERCHSVCDPQNGMYWVVALSDTGAGRKFCESDEGGGTAAKFAAEGDSIALGGTARLGIVGENPGEGVGGIVENVG